MVQFRADSPFAPMVLADLRVRDLDAYLMKYSPAVNGTIVTTGLGPGLTGSFTRAQAAYQSLGTILSNAFSPANTPRTLHQTGFGLDPVLLLEPTRTNIALWNRDLTNAAWVATNMTTAHNQTGVDIGSNAATLLTATAGNATVLQTVTLASSQRQMSAYIKRGTGFGTIQMTTDGGTTWTTINPSIVVYTRFTIPPQTVTNPSFGFRIVTSGNTIIVDLVQNETGSFPTMPVATTTTALTQDADVWDIAIGGTSPLITSQELDIAIKFIELGGATIAAQSGVVCVGGGPGANGSLFIAGSAGGSYWGYNDNQGTQVVSNTGLPSVAFGDIVTVRFRVSAAGVVLIGIAKNDLDEQLGVASAALGMSTSWANNTLSIGNRGGGAATAGAIGVLSVEIWPARTPLYVGTQNDYITKKADINGVNLITQTDLTIAPWTHGGALTVAGNVSTIDGVSMSRITNTTGAGGFTVYSAGFTMVKTGIKRFSYRIKHDGSTGQDVQLFYDNTSGVLAQVTDTFNSDGTISFALNVGTRLTVYDLGGGAYDIEVETAAVTTTNLTHVLNVYASDAVGALGTGAVPSFLIGGFRIEDGISDSRTYRNRLKNPGTLTLDALAAWSKGLAMYGIGNIQISNADLGLDAWRKYVFDGGTIDLYTAYLDRNGRLKRTLLFSGLLEQPDFDTKTITIPTRTLTYGLDKTILTNTLLGTGGLEGDASVKGIAPPRVYGYGKAMTPIPIDVANLTYLLADRHVVNPVGFDSGIGLNFLTGAGTFGEFANVAALNAIAAYPTGWTFPSGSFAYAVENGKTYVRLQNTPAGTVVFWCTDDFSTGSGGSLEVLLGQLLVDAGVPITAVVCDGFYPLSGSYPATGIAAAFGDVVFDVQRTYAEQIARLLQSAAGWMWLNPIDNVWIWGQFPGPINSDPAAAVCVINTADIKAIKKLGNPKNPGEGVPPWQVILNFDQKHTVQSSGFAGTVSPASRTFFAAEFQQRTKGDPIVKVRYPLAQAVTVDAPCLTDGSAFPVSNSIGTTFAKAYLAALSQGYDFYQITCGLTPKLLTPYNTPASGTVYHWIPATMPSFRGAWLGVKTNRFLFTNTGKGTLAGVISVSLDLSRKEVTFVVYTRYVNA